MATTLSLTTYLQRTSILNGLTTNPAVRTAAASIFPAVLVTQGKYSDIPLNSLLQNLDLTVWAPLLAVLLFSTEGTRIPRKWNHHGGFRLAI